MRTFFGLIYKDWLGNRGMGLLFILAVSFWSGLIQTTTATSEDSHQNDNSVGIMAVNHGAPGQIFDLRGWKLQIPGPQDIHAVKNYSSPYFYLNSAGQMCFWVDSAATGHTANSEYVRSELRQLANWNVSGFHRLAATVQVNSQLNPDKVTVLQIHGITEAGGNAPPLLRIALNAGDLYAFIKTDNTGNNTDSVLLAKANGSQKFNCEIRVVNQELIINVNGRNKISRSLSFWKYPNYFKAGCYPQAHHGTVTVIFDSLAVE